MRWQLMLMAAAENVQGNQSTPRVNPTGKPLRLEVKGKSLFGDEEGEDKIGKLLNLPFRKLEDKESRTNWVNESISLKKKKKKKN